MAGGGMRRVRSQPAAGYMDARVVTAVVAVYTSWSYPHVHRIAGDSYAEKLSISCAGAGVRERNGGALGAEGGTAHGLELVQEVGAAVEGAWWGLRVRRRLRDVGHRPVRASGMWVSAARFGYRILNYN